VLNSKTGAVLATLATTLTPKAMALNPATHAVFVASTGASGSVVVIDGVHDQIATTIGALPSEPRRFPSPRRPTLPS